MLKPGLSIAELCRRNKKKRQYMKVITIESSAYKAMTEQIAEIAGFVREVRNARWEKATDRLVGTEEAARMLGVCKRTLQRMRDEHRIEYAMVRGKCRYRLSEIQRLLEESTVRSTDATLGEQHHNYTLRAGYHKKGRRT